MNRPPELTAEHLLDARLFACREDLVKALFPSGAHRICEVGVAYGDFSEFLIDTLRPEIFVAADIFDDHKPDLASGWSTPEIFQGLTHREYYERRLTRKVPTLTILEGLSATTLPTLADESLDMIYIDAAHDYDGVRADGALSLRKIKPSGVLIFNDYVLFDPFRNTPFGVVRAVNGIVTQTDWRIVGFALQRDMFCDIALKRQS
jgi:hypothetical protein